MKTRTISIIIGLAVAPFIALADDTGEPTSGYASSLSESESNPNGILNPTIRKINLSYDTAGNRVTRTYFEKTMPGPIIDPIDPFFVLADEETKTETTPKEKGCATKEGGAA